MIALALLVACAAAGEAPRPELVLEGARLAVEDGPVVEAARAETVPGSGTGRAEAVRVAAAGGDAPPLELRAERSRWDLAARRVEFEGDVELVRGEVRLACAALVVRYDEAGRVEEATATGGVRVAQGDRVATGERAVLTVATGELVLTGGPELRDPLRRLTGERIVLHLDDDRVDCDRCRLVVAGEAVPVGGAPPPPGGGGPP